MKFAIPLSMLPMDEIKPLGIAADEIGYDFLAVSDHLIHPENFSVPYPYTDDGSVRWEQGTDWPDPINSLSFLAGATKNIRFYTSVYVLPARNPLRVAKEVSTLDAVSNGRFDLGIGMGWMPEEFEAGGQEFRRRGARADEMLEIMKLAQSIGKNAIESIPGLMIDDSYGDEISVTIIATGLRKMDIDRNNWTTTVPVPSNTNRLNGKIDINSDGYVKLSNLKKIDIKETLRRLKN